MFAKINEQIIINLNCVEQLSESNSAYLVCLMSGVNIGLSEKEFKDLKRKIAPEETAPENLYAIKEALTDDGFIFGPTGLRQCLNQEAQGYIFKLSDKPRGDVMEYQADFDADICSWHWLKV